MNQEIVHRVADQLLSEGVEPSAERVAERLGEAVDENLKRWLDGWWGTLNGRLCLTDAQVSPPDGLGRALKALWEDAVREAVALLSQQRSRLDFDIDQLRKESEDSIRSEKVRYDHLQELYRQESIRVRESEQQLKVVEAEVGVLKSNLAGEVARRKEAEERYEHLMAELKAARQGHEEAKKVFDARVREEQQRSQEVQSKYEAEVRHLRASLERVRDEAGKKESVLTRQVHDLQADLVKREVKIETLQGQLKGLETEFAAFRRESEAKVRDHQKISANLLSERNKTKRLEDQVRELEQALREGQQKQSRLSAEAARRESELRQQLKGREEELVRLKAQLSGAQKKLLTLEEHARRSPPKPAL